MKMKGTAHFTIKKTTFRVGVMKTQSGELHIIPAPMLIWPAGHPYNGIGLHISFLRWYAFASILWPAKPKMQKK